MARVDWALVCDLAFFDRHDRLCIVGITRKFVFPHLPVGLHQLMLVGHLVDIEPVDEIVVRIEMMTPSGWSGTVPLGAEHSLQVTGEYVLATLRDVPFVEEGSYRFSIAIGDAPAAVVDIPVWTHGAGIQDVH